MKLNKKGPQNTQNTRKKNENKNGTHYPNLSKGTKVILV
jgi:hypothetical protein